MEMEDEEEAMKFEKCTCMEEMCLSVIYALHLSTGKQSKDSLTCV